jgi:hypothetical protein
MRGKAIQTARLGLLALSLSLTLTACATTRAVKPDKSRLVCASEPAVPGAAGRPVTDSEAGDYMKAQRAAWYDCHSAVEWLRNWFSALPD